MRLVRLFVAIALVLAPTLAVAQGAVAPGLVPDRSANDNGTAPANTRYVDSATRSLLDAVNARRRADAVRPEDYREDGDLDDTASFRAAAATGRLLWLSDGQTYVVCSAIGVRRGVIGYGATIKPCSSGFDRPRETVVRENDGISQSIPRAATSSIFYNRNWSASSLTDDGLSFVGFTVDLRGTLLENDAEFHILKARMARNVLVEGVTGYGGGDLTAFQATDGTIVRNSRGYLFLNAGADHWEGPKNALVANNVFVCAGRRTNPQTGADTGPHAAIMFTAASTTLGARDGANVVSRGNIIRGGCNSGLFANILSAGGSLTNVVSDGDAIDASDYPGMAGIVLEGRIVGGRIAAPVLTGGNGSYAIGLRPDIVTTASGTVSNGRPVGIDVASPRIENWSTAANNYSPITLLGTRHVMTDARLVGGTNSASVTVEDGSSSVSGSFRPASSPSGPVRCLAGGGCVVPGVVNGVGSSLRVKPAGATLDVDVAKYVAGDFTSGFPLALVAPADGTDQSATIQAEIDRVAALPAGGTLVLGPGYRPTLKNKVTWKSKVRFASAEGAALVWAGPDTGVILDTPTDAPLEDASVSGVLRIAYGATFAGSVVKIRAALLVSIPGGFLFEGTSAKATGLDLSATNTGATPTSNVDSSGTRNIAHNVIGPIRVPGTIGTPLRMSGLASSSSTPAGGPQVVTLNTIGPIMAPSVSGTGIDIVNWADNNIIVGFNRVALTANDARGIVFQSDPSASDLGVYSNLVQQLAVDTFGTDAKRRVGAAFLRGKANEIAMYFQDPLADGPSLQVADAVDSYRVTMKADNNNALIVRQKGFVSSASAFESGNTLSVASDSAVTLTFASPRGENVTLLALTGSVAPANGLFWLKVKGGGAEIYKVAGDPTYLATRTGALNGATGDPQRITVSVAANGKIYVENRLGYAVSIKATFLGSLADP